MDESVLPEEQPRVSAGADGSSHSRRIGWIVSIGVTIALLTATTVVVVAGRGNRRPEELGDESSSPASADIPSAPVSVSLHGPLGSGAVVGVAADVAAQVLADSPIVAVQLWDGARLVEELSLPSGADRASESWQWVPEQAGTRVLLARAVTESGDVGQSAPLWLTVHEPWMPTGPSGLRTVDRATGPAGFRRPSAVPSSGRVDALAPPTVDISACSASVALPDDTATLYIAPTGSSHFLPAVQSPSSATVSFGVVGGTQLVYARTSGGAMSEPAEFTAPDSCSSDLWAGDARIVGGHLLTTKTADRAYLYLSVDGGAWRRVPADDQAFVPRGADGTFDFGQVLPPLAGAALQLEAYGRAGPDLVSLGEGTLGLQQVMSGGSDAYQQGLLDAVMAGSGRTDLDWIARRAAAGSPEIDVDEVLLRQGTLAFVDGTLTDGSELPEPAVYDFRWSTNSQAATHGIWQVSTLPPPASPELDFPGLLAYQAVPDAQGEFTIDLDAVVKGEGPQNLKLIEKVSWSDVSPQSLGLVLDPAGVVVPGSSANKKTVDKPGTSTDLPLFVLQALAELVQPTTLWVRVVPMAGTQPLPNVSNPVVYAIGDAAPPLLLDPMKPGAESPQIASTTVEFFPPHRGNPDFARCVRVVANPQAPHNLVTTPIGSYEGKPAPVGETLCATYNPPDESWLDYLIAGIDFVADVWNEVATFVNKLKDGIIELAAGLGCSQALGALDVVDDAEGACTTMIKTAVDTYLAANGIPPTLPTSDAVKEGLKGDLAALAAEAAAKYCPDVAAETCKQQAQEIAKELLDRVEEEVSDSVKAQVNSGDWDLGLADYLTVVPEPASLPGPAVFKVTVTLAEPPLTDTFCTVEPQVVGEHPSWKYATTDGTIVTKSVSGDVYVRTSGTVLIPAGASTATGVVALNNIDRSWVPQPDGSLTQTQAYKQRPPWTAWFDPEATLTMRITGCGLDSQTAPTKVITGGVPYPAEPKDVDLP